MHIHVYVYDMATQVLHYIAIMVRNCAFWTVGTPIHSNTLQHTATHCDALHHIALYTTSPRWSETALFEQQVQQARRWIATWRSHLENQAVAYNQSASTFQSPWKGERGGGGKKKQEIRPLPHDWRASTFQSLWEGQREEDRENHVDTNLIQCGAAV